MTIPNDIDAILADAAGTFGAGGPAVSVVIGAQTVTGILHRSSEPVLEGAVTHAMGDQIRVGVRTGALSGLAINAACTVGGVSYRVREIQKAGVWTHFFATSAS
jgi:hypothetical protein